MYADRYQPRRVNRGSLGLSVGIVAPLVVAAMLASPTVRRYLPDKPLVAYPVDLPPPPPPPDPQPQPPARSHLTRPVDLTRTVAPVEPKAPFTPPPQPPGLPDSGASITADPGPVVVAPVKPPPPVLTDAGVDPRYFRDFQPLYPPVEERAGRDGVVTVRVLIGVDGRVREVQQVSATSEEFWRVTQRQALARWRFRPATRDGVAVEAWKTMTVRFRLEDAD